MMREMIDNDNLENVVGGSIYFTPDHTMCGLNCDNQCSVNDFNACIDFIDANKDTMTEAEMMREMCAKGYITRL